MSLVAADMSMIWSHPFDHTYIGGIHLHCSLRLSDCRVGCVEQVAMRQEKGKKGEQLSMGFGFVECSSEEVAKAVLKRLQVWSQYLHGRSFCQDPTDSGQVRLRWHCTKVPSRLVRRQQQHVLFSQPTSCSTQVPVSRV